MNTNDAIEAAIQRYLKRHAYDLLRLKISEEVMQSTLRKKAVEYLWNHSIDQVIAELDRSGNASEGHGWNGLHSQDWK